MLVVYSLCSMSSWVIRNACKEKCGHCQNHTNCQHTDGLCAVGCDNGYHGNLCKISKSYDKRMPMKIKIKINTNQAYSGNDS